jgi:5-formyltetrahydrofolate cyclo-ligase
MSGETTSDKTSVKVALRADILSRRRALSVHTFESASACIAAHVLRLVRDLGAHRVCAYLPVGTEPGSAALLDDLHRGGVVVLLPVVLPDEDLDWAAYGGASSLVDAGRGLREPTGPRLGVTGIGSADLVLVPALAVDRRGNRLGRGGGCYDRALARVAPGVPVVALLHDGEFVESVPVQGHDRPVTHVVLPSRGCLRVGSAATGTQDSRPGAAAPHDRC